MHYSDNMNFLIKSSLIFSALIAGVLAARDLPSYFPRCKRFDPKLNECLMNATEIVRPFLIKGVPELGLRSVEPYIIPQITLQQGTQALNFKAILKDVEVRGLSSYKFTQFDFDVPNLTWYWRATMARMNLTGDYSVTGKILLAPIEGRGKFSANIENSNITGFQTVEFFERKGEQYVRPTITNSTITVGDPKVKLDGLFGGNEELTKVTNTVINENINELFEDLKPVIEEILTNILEQWLLKALEDNIPFRKLYPVD